MKFINKYIDWKNSIKPGRVFGLDASFKYAGNLDAINQFKSWNLSLSDDKLITLLKSDEFEFDEFDSLNFQQKRTFGKKFSLYHDSLIEDSSYSRSIKFGFTVNEKIILENNYYIIVQDNYPKALLNCIQDSEIAKNLKLIIMFNPIDLGWEMNKRPSAYKYKKGLSTLIDPQSKRKIVDVSKRAGRVTLLNNFYFKGGFEFWFGNEVFEQIPKERIKSFPHANEISELPNNIIRVKLFEMDQYWEDFAQDRLSAFRKHLMIDELETQFLSSIKEI